MRVSDLSVGLLAYYVGTHNVYALLIDQGGRTSRFSLCACAQVFDRIDRLMNALEQPYAWTPAQRDKVVAEFADDWGRQLLPPADALRGFDVLVIVPHHFVHGVPLHLVTSGDQPLALSHGIAYCSSATLLDRCVERNRAREADGRAWTFPIGSDGGDPTGPPVRTCLSYGVDVLTDKDAAYRELAEAFALQFSQKALATSRSEIKGALDMSRRIDGADPARVQPDAICLVCHGYYDGAHAEQAGLLLAGRRGILDMRRIRVHGDSVLRVQDHPFGEIPLRLDPVQPRSALVGIFDPEVLTTGELRVQCETDAQLVALFGCSTGAGAVTANDDYVSHAYQWLKMGAASVIANLWEADFPVITDWAQRFAVNWVQHQQPKAIAAREATRSLLANRPELAGQPALWGSVSVLGDWL